MKEDTKTTLKVVAGIIFFLLFIPAGAILGSKVAEGFYVLCAVPVVAFIVCILIIYDFIP